MWLLNATTEDQRKGLADYFSPNNLMSHASSGIGQPFGGHTVYDHGAMVSDRGAAQVLVGMRPVVQDPPEQDSDTPLIDDPHGAAAQAGPAGKTDAATPGSAQAKPAKPEPGDHGATSPGPGPAAASAGATNAAATNTGAARASVTPVGVAGAEAAKPPPVVAHTETQPGNRAPTEADIRAAEAAREKLAFEQAAEQIRQAVGADPALAALSRQLAIDITPEGLRIQLLDEERLPMFATGSSTPNERAGLLLAKVAPVLMRLPEAIAVVGHTDAAPYTGNGKTNWELSTERANATRRLLTDAGLAEARVSRVTGLADRDPLLPADPLAAANRRIAIIVLRGTQKPAATPSAPPSAAVHAPSSVSPSTAAPSTGAPDPSSAAPSPAGSASPSASPSTPAFARPSGAAPAPSVVPPSISGPAPSSTPPSVATPTQSPAAPPAPSFGQPFTPSPAPVSASLSAPSSTPSTASPSEPAQSNPASDAASDPETAPSSTPSFVPSFLPSFTTPSHAPSVAAPVLPEPPP